MFRRTLAGRGAPRSVSICALAFPAVGVGTRDAARERFRRTARCSTWRRGVPDVFDDTVRVGGGTPRPQRRGTSVLGGDAVAHGRVVTLPAATDLRDGNYTVAGASSPTTATASRA